MNRPLHHLRLLLLCGCLSVAGVHGAVVLTSYNSYSLLDADGITFLQGTSSAGALVQIILDGNADGPDAPDAFGLPGGDDSLLSIFSGDNPTHVGAGEGPGTWNMGYLTEVFSYDDADAGLSIYLRFWNRETQALSTHYGNSASFVLPAGDLFGLADLDFVPLSSSPRITDIPFQAEAPAPVAVVPEANTLLVFGVALVVWIWGRRQEVLKSRAARRMILAALGGSTNLPAQLPVPLDVTASSAIFGADGEPLPGTHPSSAAFGIPFQAGDLVQVLACGPDQKMDWPQADGQPGGDDILLAELAIGQGIDPTHPQSGRFAATLRPPPAPGTRLYVRVFDAPDLAAATRWGQSAVVSHTPSQVLDVSRLALIHTGQIKGVSDPAQTDSDQDGVSDLSEWLANTRSDDAEDRFRIERVEEQGRSITLQGYAGRRYHLERSLDALSGSMNWTPVDSRGPLGVDTLLILRDPAPPADGVCAYRLRVE